jgi:hypothetical protein
MLTSDSSHTHATLQTNALETSFLNGPSMTTGINGHSSTSGTIRRMPRRTVYSSLPSRRRSSDKLASPISSSRPSPFSWLQSRVGNHGLATSKPGWRISVLGLSEKAISNRMRASRFILVWLPVRIMWNCNLLPRRHIATSRSSNARRNNLHLPPSSNRVIKCTYKELRSMATDSGVDSKCIQQHLGLLLSHR